jgi:MmyB-like transcription regulator ligand binding domain
MSKIASPSGADEPPLVDMSSHMRNLRSKRKLGDVATKYVERLSQGQLEKAQRNQGLTQEVVAAMALTTVGHYGNFERRGGPGVSAQMTQAFIEILGCNPTEARAVYRWAQHPAPDAPVDQLVDEALRRYLNKQPNAAVFVSQTSYDIVAYNELAAIHLPPVTMPGANMLEWVLGPDEALRTMLVDWRESWAVPMLELYRRVKEEYPNDARLRQVEAKMRENPETVRLLKAGGRMTRSLSRAKRRIMLPLISKDPIYVQIVSMEPSGEPGICMMIFEPVGQGVRDLSNPLQAHPLRSAQFMADAVLEKTGGAVVTANYKDDWLQTGHTTEASNARRRAAISMGSERPPLSKDFIGVGELLPPLSPSPAQSALYRVDEWLDYPAIVRLLDNDERRIRQLVPGLDIVGGVHSELTDGEGNVIGDIQVWQAEGGPQFTPRQVEDLCRIISIRMSMM